MTRPQLEKICQLSYATGIDDILSILNEPRLGPSGALIAQALGELAEIYKGGDHGGS